MIAAILVLLLVAALLTVLAFSMMSSVDQSNSSARDTRSVAWLQAASEDLASRLVNFDIGATFAPAASPVAGYRLLSVPTSGIPGAVYNSGQQAFQITVNEGGINQTGYYRIMPPLPGMSPTAYNLAAEYVGTPGVVNRNQGAITMILRGWLAGTTQTRARDVKVTFRRGSLARFAVLTEDTIDVASLGALNLTGSLHANNIRWSPSNPIPGITIGGGVSTAAVERISTTRGPIVGACPASRCHADTQKTVSFTAVDVAQNQVARLSGMGKCGAGAFEACSISRFTGGAYGGTIDRIPGYEVNLGGGGGSVTIRAVEFQRRPDVLGQPRLDDKGFPVVTPGGFSTTLTPGSGGGAILLDADAYVLGQRPATAPPVTILVRRPANFQTIRFRNDVGAVLSGVKVTDPASIYVTQGNGSNGDWVGAASSANPVGLVAEGGIYVPSWGLQRNPITGNRVDNFLWMRNMAVMAKQAEFSLGPSILAIASDSIAPSATTLENGGGIDPATPSGGAAALSYGQGSQMRFDGAMATNRPPVFRYGNGNFIGYLRRQVNYVPDLTWNPPPFYPADDPWHLSDWSEYSS